MHTSRWDILLQSSRCSACSGGAGRPGCRSSWWPLSRYSTPWSVLGDLSATLSLSTLCSGLIIGYCCHKYHRKSTGNYWGLCTLGSPKCTQSLTPTFSTSPWRTSVSWSGFPSWSPQCRLDSGPSGWQCARSTSPRPPSIRSRPHCSWWCCPLIGTWRCVTPSPRPGSGRGSSPRWSASPCGSCQVRSPPRQH